jgi:hypothetical protein
MAITKSPNGQLQELLSPLFGDGNMLNRDASHRHHRSGMARDRKAHLWRARLRHPARRGRTAGIVYTVRDRDIYIVTGRDSWKVRHIALDLGVSLSVTIPKRIPFMPWGQIPPATISFQGDGSIHDIEEVPRPVLGALLRGLEVTPELRKEMCVIRIRPVGEFVTYGVSVSLMAMRKPEAARGRAPV